MGFRLKFALLIFGGVLMFVGGQLFLVSYGTDSKPLDVDLARLESGQALENNYITVNDHIALFDVAVYAWETSSANEKKPKRSSKLSYAFYPIISPAHPWSKKYDELQRLIEQADEEAIDNFEFPSLDQFSILVKTHKYKTFGALPESIAAQARIRGLVINQIDSLDSEEEELVKESFPRLDLEKVLILEAERRPASLGTSLGMICGGLLLVIAGVVSLCWGKISNRDAKPQDEWEASVQEPADTADLSDQQTKPPATDPDEQQSKDQFS